MFDFLDIQPDSAALFAEARRDGVTLFGAGNFARAVSVALGTLGVPVRAFVVSEASSTHLDKVPVVPLHALSDATRALPLWIAVYNRSADSALTAIAARCRASGITRVRLPQEYYETLEEPLGWRFWLANRHGYRDARANIEAVYALLDDEESRRGFLATLRFRLALPMEGGPSPSAAPQYFPDFILAALAARGKSCIFLDGGAYDGDTIRQAAATLSVARTYAFEPDLANYARLAAQVAALGLPVVSYPCGLSNATAWLAFAGDHGEASAISPEGNNHILCVRLDDCLISEPVDYIKLDVEGHEVAALAGAGHIIARDRPVLAIAAYHRWDDLWRIPLSIRALVPDYRIVYRIHEHNTFESVFYAHC